MPNLQNQSLSESGQIVTTGDTGVVTSAMIVDGTIANADVSTSAAIDLSKLASGTSAQIVLANSTGVATYTAVSGDITITNAGVVSLASNITISNNLTVTGDLTVSGNTTTLNTANLNVEDSFILLNSGVTGSPTLDSGLEVERGTSTNVFIRWNETTDKWQFTNDGSTYNDLGSGGGATNSLTAPVSPAAGALWFKTDTAQTFVYYVDGTSNQWVEIGSSGMAAYIADSAPNNPIAGQFWYNSSEASTYVYYDSQWIEIGASGMSAIISDTAPTNPITGQIWYNSSDGGTYVYYNSIWVEIGAAPFNTLLSSINAKGDLLVGTANDTVAGLTAGSNGTFLKANSATATGLEWASIPAINTLDDVGDVTITSASSGQVLQWNGTAWINATVSSDVMTDAKNAALIIMDIGA
jgi:hypothetical protein